MSKYTKNMCKKVNQKDNVQAYPYPNQKGVNSRGSSIGTVRPKEHFGFSSNGNSSSNERTSNGFSHKAPSLATDLHCYFQCPETFKKDYDLRLHLKLRHKNEEPEELSKAYQAAEDEIAFTKRSGSKSQCAICQKNVSE